jgi:hypothetical protein
MDVVGVFCQYREWRKMRRVFVLIAMATSRPSSTYLVVSERDLDI